MKLVLLLLNRGHHQLLDGNVFVWLARNLKVREKTFSASIVVHLFVAGDAQNVVDASAGDRRCG